MPTYRIFGLIVQSARALEGLTAWHEDSAAHVRVRAGDPVPMVAQPDDSLIGADPREPCRVQWWKRHTADVLSHACAGWYEMAWNGPSETVDVVVHPNASADDATIRMDLLGRVLPIVLHRRGTLCLHAGAVQIRDRALLFVAPKGTGKSSLSAAVIAQGALPLADDATAISLSSPAAAVWPGVRGVRVRPDVRDAHPTLSWLSEDAVDGKCRLDPVVPVQQGDPVRLDAVYVLRAVEADAAAPVTRHRLSSRDALAALLGQGKLAPILGGADAAIEFRQLAQLAMSTPVYRLDVARNLARLASGAAQITDWHTAERRDH